MKLKNELKPIQGKGLRSIRVQIDRVSGNKRSERAGRGVKRHYPLTCAPMR